MPAGIVRSGSAINPRLRNAQPDLHNSQWRRFARSDREFSIETWELSASKICPRQENAAVSRKASSKEKRGESGSRLETNSQLSSVNAGQLGACHCRLGPGRI